MINTLHYFSFVEYGGDVSPDLLEVDLAIVSNDECRVNLGEVRDDVHICAGYPEGGRDACQG